MPGSDALISSLACTAELFSKSVQKGVSEELRWIANPRLSQSSNFTKTSNWLSEPKSSATLCFEALCTNLALWSDLLVPWEKTHFTTHGLPPQSRPRRQKWGLKLSKEWLPVFQQMLDRELRAFLARWFLSSSFPRLFWVIAYTCYVEQKTVLVILYIIVEQLPGKQYLLQTQIAQKKRSKNAAVSRKVCTWPVKITWVFPETKDIPVRLKVQNQWSETFQLKEESFWSRNETGPCLVSEKFKSTSLALNVNLCRM